MFSILPVASSAILYLRKEVPTTFKQCLDVRRFAKLVKTKNWIHHWKLRVGDEVVVISGDDKGRSGKIIQCDVYRNQVRVQGCKLRKIIVADKPLMVEKKMHYSNVLLMDPVMRIPTRIAVRFSDNGFPYRVSKKSGVIIPWPEENQKKSVPDFSEANVGPKDTAPEVALQKTYNYREDNETLRMIRQSMSKYNRDLSV